MEAHTFELPNAAHSGRGASWPAWLPLVLLTAGVLAFRDRLEPWVFMWSLAVAIFAGCKWQTLSYVALQGGQQALRRRLAYLFLWPGMDARAFLARLNEIKKPSPAEWLAATTRTIFGAALIWLTVRATLPFSQILAGWFGMIGMVLLFHFGAFHLISLAWRSAGVNAQPIMRRPLSAHSLSDFWGSRWNLGFRPLSHALVFQPLRKRAGNVIATLAAFLMSGLIHELVISVPARAGYGLPTMYFLIQGVGVVIERSTLGERFALGQGIRGWFWTSLFTAGPAYWLFHPPFVYRVILPFLRAIGAS
jgi:hypothetical protein